MLSFKQNFIIVLSKSYSTSKHISQGLDESSTILFPYSNLLRTLGTDIPELTNGLSSVGCFFQCG